MSSHAGHGTHLIHAVSYEDRGLDSLQALIEGQDIGHVHLMIFKVDKYLSLTQHNTWRAQYASSKALLEAAGIECHEFEVKDSGPSQWRFLDHCDELNEDILVNITTMPKIYIMAIIARLWANPRVSYYYQPIKVHDVQADDSYDVTVSEMRVVDGLEGLPTLGGREHLLVMLGYEAERAVRCWRMAAPNASIVGIIGLPDWQGDPWDQREASLSERDRHYLEIVPERNRRLLDASGAKPVRVNSVDARTCHEQLEEVWARLADQGVEERNALLLPLGTKAQAAAAATFALQHPGLQVVYGIPNRRPTMSGEPRDPIIFRREGDTWATTSAGPAMTTPAS